MAKSKRKTSKGGFVTRTISIPEGLDEFLKGTAMAQERSVSWVVVNALRKYFEAEAVENPLRGFDMAKFMDQIIPKEPPTKPTK